MLVGNTGCLRSILPFSWLKDMKSSSFQSALEPVSKKKNSNPNLRIKDSQRPGQWWRKTMDPPSSLTIRTEIT